MCILLAENRPRGRGPTIEVRSVIAPEVKIRGSVGRSSTLRRSGRGPKRAMVSRGTIIGWRRRSNGPAKWPRNKMVRNGGYVGPGRGGPKRRQTTEQSVRYQITSVTRHEAAIERLVARMGWQAQLTNAPASRLSLVE